MIHLLLREEDMHTGVVLKGESEEVFVLEMPHILYYGFTIDAFFSIQRVHNSYLDVRRKSDPLNKAEEQIIKDFNFWCNSFVLYGALTLEAFINYYGTRYLKLTNNERKQNRSVKDKWRYFIKKKLGVQLDDKIEKKLKFIFDLRNAIAHTKSNVITLDSNDENWKESIGAKLEILDKGMFLYEINQIFKYVFSIDEEEAKSSQNPTWLQEIQKIN